MASSSDPIATPLPAPTRPTLPTELLEQILEQPSLSKVDLAQCCLVSRHLLNPARRSLYAQIRFECCLASPTSTVTYAPTKPTLRLVRTFRSSPSLAVFVKSLYCDGSARTFEGDYYGKHAREVLVNLLDALPRVNKLHLLHSAFKPVQEYVRTHATRWTGLELSSVDTKHEFALVTSFTNLKKLKCRHFVTYSQDRFFYLPPGLTHLDLGENFYLPLSVPKASSSSLKYLNINSCDFIHFPDLARIPGLQHLMLLGGIGTQDTVPSVADLLGRCRSLISLTLANSSSEHRNDSYRNLLDRLPVSLIRLDFPGLIPFESLVKFFESGTLNSLRTLGLSGQACGAEVSLEKIANLLNACDINGIEVEYIGKNLPSFDI